MYPRSFDLPKSSFFLFGARGTGKTSLLESKLNADFTIELLSQENYLQYATDPSLLRRQLELMKPGQWVWIDEIQRLPELLNEVHWGIEKKRLKFALSGSSSRKLRKAGVNLLGGRALSKILYPFIPEELGDDFELESTLKYGAIPLIFKAKNKKEQLRAYVHTYLREEVQAEAYVKDLPSFARFLKVAALLHSQTLNLSSVARDVGVKRPTIENYFSVLEDTLLARRLWPYDAGIRVKEKHQPKFYWIDPGLVRALREEWGDVSTSDRGSLFEGYIFNLLNTYKTYFDAIDEIYYWASSNTEVDFLLKRNSKFYALEVKSGNRFRKEDTVGLKSIVDLPKLEKRFLIYPVISRQKTEDGIEIMDFFEFFKLLKKGL